MLDVPHILDEIREEDASPENHGYVANVLAGIDLADLTSTQVDFEEISDEPFEYLLAAAGPAVPDLLVCPEIRSDSKASEATLLRSWSCSQLIGRFRFWWKRPCTQYNGIIRDMLTHRATMMSPRSESWMFDACALAGHWGAETTVELSGHRNGCTLARSAPHAAHLHPSLPPTPLRAVTTMRRHRGDARVSSHDARGA